MNAFVLLIALFAAQAEAPYRAPEDTVQTVESDNDIGATEAERAAGMWIAITCGVLFVSSLFVYQFKRVGKPKGAAQLRKMDMCGH